MQKWKVNGAVADAFGYHLTLYRACRPSFGTTNALLCLRCQTEESIVDFQHWPMTWSHGERCEMDHEQGKGQTMCVNVLEVVAVDPY